MTLAKGIEPGEAAPAVLRLATGATRSLFARRLLLLAAIFIGAGIALNGLAWWIDAAFAIFGRRSYVTDALDFTAFYPAAHLMAHGHVDSLYDTEVFEATAHSYGVLALHPSRTLPFMNPPFFALVLAPLGVLSFDQAFQAWAVVNLIALAMVCVAMWRVAAGEQWVWRVALILLLVTARPVPFSLQLGQFSLILLAAWTGAFLAMRSGRSSAAGICLAACLIKPEIVIPAVLLLGWHRRWDVLRPFAGAALFLAAVSVAIVGAQGSIEYALFILRAAMENSDGTQTNLMMGWNAVFEGALRHSYPGIETLVAIPASLLTIAALIWSCRRSFGGGDDLAFASRWLLITILTMLVDPHFYLQDAVLLTAPACFFVVAARGHVRAVASLAAIGGWWVLSRGFEPNLDWGIALVPLYMFAVSVVIMVWMERRERGASGESAHPAGASLPLAA